MRLTSSDIPAFDAYQHKTQTSLAEIFDSSARSNKQSRSAWSALGRCHIVATSCFIVLVKVWHRSRALHVHICCFPTVLSGRRGRIAQSLLWFLSLSSSTGEFSANSVLEFVRKLWLAVLHKFCSRFVMVSTATFRIGPPAATTRNLDMEEHIAHASTQDTHAMFHVLATNEQVCAPLVDTTFDKLGEHEWRKRCPIDGYQSECALSPLWSGCPHRPSSTAVVPTILQATWREHSAEHEHP